ncbi:hypothetical protein A2U01_0090238, partial [Trifolium medium]|nr:hypothetical protein [Trifolium medium]
VGVVDLDADAEETPDNKRSKDLDPDSASKQILKKSSLKRNKPRTT